MTIYRNKNNKLLYIIEHLILDIRFLNNNSNAGIYAYPYKNTGEKTVYKSKSTQDCLNFVNNNFTKVSYK